MANLSNLIFGAAVATASITTPALAASTGKPIYARQNEYVTRSHQGVYDFAPTPPVNDPAARPYHYDPINAPNGP
jgi:hypothetical protein